MGGYADIIMDDGAGSNLKSCTIIGDRSEDRYTLLGIG